MKKSTIVMTMVLAIMLLAISASAEDYKVQGDDSSFKLGRSFNEAGLTVGGYWNDQDLRGAYIMLEVNRWIEQKNASRNWSFLGGVLMYEPGEVGDYEWEKFKILYQPGLYQPLDDHETIHLLFKPRIGFYIDRGTSEDEGLAYGGIAEFIKTLDPLNKFGLTFDSMFESRENGKDGFIAIRPFYEKGWANGNSMKISAGPIFHITPDDSSTSFCPGASLRIPINADYALNLGASVDFGEETETYGFFVSISWNDIRYNFK